MKQVQIDRYGTPWDVARTADVPDVGDPGPDEVVFDVLAFPINPADMWFCRGSYRLKPPLPATPGAECVGRVAAVGAAVKHVKKGDLVINLQRENWAQRRKVKGDDAIPLPAGIDLRQAAMVRINPPTAQLMLSDFVDLKPGDWVIQNVANSAVGRLLIVLARQRGLRTVNVVRRVELAHELKALGADIVIVDGDDLAQRVARQTAEARIMLGVEAIGGAATGRLADCLATDGTLVHYGSMSGEDPSVGSQQLHLPRCQAHRLHARSVSQPSQPREDPRDLRRSRRAGDGRQIVGAGRHRLSDREDQGRAGARRQGRAQRQDPGEPQRSNLRVGDLNEGEDK